MSENYLVDSNNNASGGLFAKNMKDISSMFEIGNPKAHLFPHRPRKHTTKQHQDKKRFSSSSSSSCNTTTSVEQVDDNIHTEAEKMLIKQFNEKIRFGDPNTPITAVTIDNNNNTSKNNNNTTEINNNSNRRASDSSYITQQQQSESPTFQYHQIKKPISPSHYKGKRRGTYAAVYDPRVTLARPKTSTRSRSLFIKASDELSSSSSSSSLTQNDLRIRLLKSFQAKNNLSFSGSENSTSSEDDAPQTTATTTPRQPQEEQRSKHHHQRDGKHMCSKHHRHHHHSTHQQRAHSTIHNLSKDHLKYLETKYTQSQQLKQHCVEEDPNNNKNNNNNIGTTKYGEKVLSLHGACEIGDFKKIKDMIDAGHDVNESDSFGRSPCYYAILNGHFDCVSLLVANGANLNDYFQKQKQSYFNNNC